jgi:hypothetical protein
MIIEITIFMGRISNGGNLNTKIIPNFSSFKREKEVPMESFNKSLPLR